MLNSLELSTEKLLPLCRSEFTFKRSLGEDIFNYLQSKDDVFKNVVIKRQKRYRNFQKKQNAKEK
jgi:hypothetical protein